MLLLALNPGKSAAELDNLILSDDDLIALQTPCPIGHVVVRADPLNVRRGPGTQYGSVGALNRGEVVEKWGETNGWLCVRGRFAGWVAGQYCEAVT